MADTAGWILIGLVALAYVRSRQTQLTPAEVLLKGPTAEAEVDPTRWRHDGTQPNLWTRGNGITSPDETVGALRQFL